MGQVIQLDQFRKAQRKAYIKKYEAQLAKYITHFLQLNLRHSYEEIRSHYLRHLQESQEQSWDYIDFRETLREGFQEAFGTQILAECRRLYWFDERYLCVEEIVDRCVSAIVLDPEFSAAR